MKKIIIVLIVIILALGITVVVYSTFNNMNNTELSKNIYKNHKDDVDAGVQELMSLPEYEKMNEEEKIEIVGNILDLYEKAGIIKNIYFDSSSPMYSFVYASGDIEGALGGVTLKSFNPLLN